MGKKKIQKQADQLGLTSQRLISLYTQPQALNATMRKEWTDVSDAIRDYIALQDPAFEHKGTFGMRKHAHFYLAANIKLYIEVFDKAKGFGSGDDVRIRVEQINIYSANDEYVRGIAQVVDSLWEKNPKQGFRATLKRGRKLKPGGMLVNLDWKRIRKAFKVEKEDCIATWNHWLQSEPTLPSKPLSTSSAPLTPTSDYIAPSPFTNPPRSVHITPPSPFSSTSQPDMPPAVVSQLSGYKCPSCETSLSTQKVENLKKGLISLCENCFETIKLEMIMAPKIPTTHATPITEFRCPNCKTLLEPQKVKNLQKGISVFCPDCLRSILPDALNRE